MLVADQNNKTRPYDGHLRSANQPSGRRGCLSVMAFAIIMVGFTQNIVADDKGLAFGDTIAATALEAWETEDGNQLHLRHNVEITAPDWRIEASSSTLVGKLENPDLIRADGSPARIFVVREDDEKPFSGRSLHIEFNPHEDTVRLTGEAVVEKGRESIRSQSIDYDLDGDTFIAGERGRVRVIRDPMN